MNNLTIISNMYFFSCSSVKFEMNRQYLDPLPRLHTTSAWVQSRGLPLQVSRVKVLPGYLTIPCGVKYQEGVYRKLRL